MKSDRRVRYTKMVLRQSLVELMGEKPLAKITIKELCERADVNRGTFYVHYSDQFDLLDQTQNELLDSIRTIVDDNKANVEQGGAIDILTKVCAFMKDNRGIITCLYDCKSESKFAENVRNLFREVCISYWGKLSGIADADDDKIYYDFTVAGVIGTIFSWLISGCTVATDDIAERIYGLCFRAFKVEE